MADLLADLAVRGALAGVLRFPLGHEFSLLCVAVPPRAGTVVHIGAGVNPHLGVGIPCLLTARVFIDRRRGTRCAGLN